MIWFDINVQQNYTQAQEVMHELISKQQKNKVSLKEQVPDCVCELCWFLPVYFGLSFSICQRGTDFYQNIAKGHLLPPVNC